LEWGNAQPTAADPPLPDSTGVVLQWPGQLGYCNDNLWLSEVVSGLLQTGWIFQRMNLKSSQK